MGLAKIILKKFGLGRSLINIDFSIQIINKSFFWDQTIIRSSTYVCCCGKSCDFSPKEVKQTVILQPTTLIIDHFQLLPYKKNSTALPISAIIKDK